jgi:hypothetical protein
VPGGPQQRQRDLQQWRRDLQQQLSLIRGSLASSAPRLPRRDVTSTAWSDTASSQVRRSATSSPMWRGAVRLPPTHSLTVRRSAASSCLNVQGGGASRTAKAEGGWGVVLMVVGQWCQRAVVRCRRQWACLWAFVFLLYKNTLPGVERYSRHTIVVSSSFGSWHRALCRWLLTTNSLL